MNYKLSLCVLSQIRKLSTSQVNSRKNHYDSLGIAKSATQADVKGAYYELSKVYHPDKNHGNTQMQRDQHSQKFRDITEAYEVLGNVRSRKMYDKGFMVDYPNTTRHHSQADPLHKFYKSRDIRNRPTSTGRTPIYDFDEWSKQHYGEAFKRSQEMKQRQAFYANMKAKEKDDTKLDIMIWSTVIFIGFCMCINALGKSVIGTHLFGANVRKGPSVKDVD